MNESKAIMSLLELEQQAFKLRDEGEITDAIVLLQELLEREPSWEHGYGAFLLATCLEDTNQITQAKKYYQIALSYILKIELYWVRMPPFCTFTVQH